jgi:3-oxoacyl-[acyl-carrier-protein] synthase-3
MFLPERVLTNHDLEQFMDTNDEWITKRTGIKERHFAEEGVGTSDLAVEAARQALDEAGLTGRDLDAIICCTLTPDMVMPGVSHILQARLSAEGSAAFDLNCACTGFIVGLATADAFIRANNFKTILLVGADTTSRLVNWDYRDTAVLFADGAGAVVLQAVDEDAGVLYTHIEADGAGSDILKLEQGGFRYAPTPERVASDPLHITMNGKELFKRAVVTFENEIQTALDQTGFTADDVDLFIPHQANARIIEAVRERVGLAPDKVMVNIDKTGNTVAASIPMALHEARQAGRVNDGDLLVLSGFGAGLSWGSAVVRW